MAQKNPGTCREEYKMTPNSSEQAPQSLEPDENYIAPLYEPIAGGIVCFGDSDWWYHNRGHMDMQLMRQYARYTRVLYVNSLIVRKFNFAEGRMFFRRATRKLLSISRGVRPSGVRNMSVYSPFGLPVHHIKWMSSVNTFGLKTQLGLTLSRLKMKEPLIWAACPAAALLLDAFASAVVIYQRSDIYEQYPGIDPDTVVAFDRKLKSRADMVIYSSRLLLDQESAECRNAVFVDHGVDYEAFALAHQDALIPDQMREIPHPILGFYGSIDPHTCDMELIGSLAENLPDFSIVLIGDSSVDLSDLRRRKNVYLLGPKSYKQIPHYAKCFDVCFMPWNQNEWIKNCNPVKLKEYLALGKPVVSTPFAELKHYRNIVSVASGPAEFASRAREAFRTDNAQLTALRQRRTRGHSWGKKAQAAMLYLSRIVGKEHKC